MNTAAVLLKFGLLFVNPKLLFVAIYNNVINSPLPEYCWCLRYDKVAVMIAECS